MRQKKEFIEPTKATQRSWAIGVALYLLMLLWLEPVMDSTLELLYPATSSQVVAQLNQTKAYVATIAFSIVRALPLLLFFLVGWLIVRGSLLPPTGVKLPFTVQKIAGAKARLIGMMMIAVALLSLLREILVMASAG
jgi:hypothetical protein